MSARIRILEESLASKIAAGEVVERPESVLKELLENSVDAGATAISVTVAEGGKRLIRVSDNGSGISRQDAPLAFLRHATSKISEEGDLERISTMGFRGEALASISAVSRVVLRTRRPGEEAGTRVEVEGGSAPVTRDDGCPEGTSVEVRDLFYNTPARLKFLRGPEAEYGRMLETFRKIALANPSLRMKMAHGTARALESASGTLRHRISDIFGLEAASSLIQMDTPDLKGFIGPPGQGHPTARYLYTYVNNRWVRDRAINRAILDGYGRLLDGGRYPFAVLDLRVPPQDVDVNIHPAKSEVRFRNPNYIYDLVKYGVRSALAGPAKPRQDAPSAEGPSSTAGAAEQAWSYRAEALSGQLELKDDAAPAKSPELLGLEVIGQLWGEFLVAQGHFAGGELYLIDQHGAAERCAFERLKERLRTGGARSQALLLPERVETTPEEKEELAAALGRLSSLGFEIEPFGPSPMGGESFLIRSVPDLLIGRPAAGLIKDLAQELASSGGGSGVDERLEGALMRIACHSVVRGPRQLAAQEARSLLGELSKVDFSGHCPHGRPVVKRIPRGEIEKMFKR